MQHHFLFTSVDTLVNLEPACKQFRIMHKMFLYVYTGDRPWTEII